MRGVAFSVPDPPPVTRVTQVGIRRTAVNFTLDAAAGNLEWLSRLFLGTLFVVSGSSKLARRTRLRDTIAAMELVRPDVATVVATILPPLEVALGIWVLTRWRTVLSGPLVLAALAFFSLVLIVYRMRGGTEIACGCFADFDRKTRTSTVIVRNVLLIAAALPLLHGSDPVLPARPVADWLIASTTMVGLVVAWNLLARFIDAVVFLRSLESRETG